MYDNEDIDLSNLPPLSDPETDQLMAEMPLNLEQATLVAKIDPKTGEMLFEILRTLSRSLIRIQADRVKIQDLELELMP